MYFRRRFLQIYEYLRFIVNNLGANDDKINERITKSSKLFEAREIGKRKEEDRDGHGKKKLGRREDKLEEGTEWR